MQAIRPNKIVLYSKIYTYDNELKCERKPIRLEKNKMPSSRFHNFEISKDAQKTISEKISWLYQLAKSTYQKTSSGKEIFNFKMSFITLTLPSIQKHPTSEITSKCLNQLLIELRDEFELKNYVWRLEFQKNGNVHYHIAMDKFIDYERLRIMWNRIIGKLGYIKAYQDKFWSMSLNDYVTNYSTDKKTDFSTLAKRYARGKKENWENPPSVDVISCTSGKAISFYIAKYFNKKEKSGIKCNHLDNESNSANMRLWFCSRGLSKLKSISEYVQACEIPMELMFDNVKGMITKVYDYCKVIYFDFAKLCPSYKRLLTEMYRQYAIDVGYL